MLFRHLSLSLPLLLSCVKHVAQGCGRQVLLACLSNACLLRMMKRHGTSDMVPPTSQRKCMRSMSAARESVQHRLPVESHDKPLKRIQGSERLSVAQRAKRKVTKWRKMMFGL